MKAIIFDFDGVIHDTFDIHYKANQIHFNRKLCPEGFKDLSNGNNFEEHSNRRFNLEEYIKLIKKRMSSIKISSKIINELLNLAQKYELFIISSTSEKVLKEVMINNQLQKVFKCILGRETANSKIEKFSILFQQYNLNKDNSIFVTDTLGDILEANKIGIKTIAVDFGYHEIERLKKGNPFIIISDFNNISKIVKTL